MWYSIINTIALWKLNTLRCRLLTGIGNLTFNQGNVGSNPIGSAKYSNVNKKWILSGRRLAAIPPRLGRGFRGFESHRPDHIHLLCWSRIAAITPVLYSGCRGFESLLQHHLSGGSVTVGGTSHLQCERKGSIPLTSTIFAQVKGTGLPFSLKMRSMWVRIPPWVPLDKEMKLDYNY